ncbi:MAG: ATP-binding protein [Planctomycetota bacterium]|nr:ATP-binding protein [Planctomycetota bacterium]
MGKVAERELTVGNDTAYLSEVRNAVLELLGDGPFPPAEAQLVALAVDEAVANVMEHAYSGQQFGPDCRIRIRLAIAETQFEVRIHDTGKRFDPNSVPDVDIQEHVRQGRRGGLGIFLIRRIMDVVDYRFEAGPRNELRLVKFVDNSPDKAKSGKLKRQAKRSR